MHVEHKVRPYWHVDLKWIFGIFASFFLFIFLILFILSNLTSEKTAVPVATLIVASQFSRDGLDDPKDIEIVREKFLASGQDVFYPLGDKNVKITKEELETLSPREIRLKIFRQVVEPYYYEGVEGVAERVATNSAQKEQIKKQAGLLGLINIKTHQIIFQILLVSLVPLVISLAGLVYFSYRFGRLVSPAFLFLTSSFIPTILLFLISNAHPPLDKQGKSEGFPFLSYEIIKSIAKTIAPPFYLLFWLGIGLLAAALITKIVRRSNSKKES